MTLQFQHIFAGKGVRAWEPQRNALVQRFPVGITEGQIVGVAGFRQLAQQCLSNLSGFAAGNAQDAHTTAAWRRRLGDDSLAMTHIRLSFFGKKIRRSVTAL